jgi:hypothetical protein
MTYGHAWLVWRILSLVLAAIFCIAATLGLFADFDSTRDTVLWVSFLVGGAILIFLGQWAYRYQPWLSAALVSIGAAAGGLPLFWTLVVPLAVAVLIALSFALARRPLAAA